MGTRMPRPQYCENADALKDMTYETPEPVSRDPTIQKKVNAVRG